MTDIEEVNGVDSEAAEILRRNHIEYVRDLAVARCDRIEDRMGLSVDLVVNAIKMKRYGESFMKQDVIDYECDYCGEEFKLMSKVSFERHEAKCSLNLENHDDTTGNGMFTDEVVNL